MKRLLLPIALAALACSEDPSQLMVHVQADSIVAAAGGRLQIEVFGGADPSAPLSPVATEVVDPAEYPYVLAIAPRNDDASRHWRVEATLTSSLGTLTRTATGTFAEGETKRLDLLLEADCVGVSCDAETTCFTGVCDDDRIDVASLPPWEGPLDGVLDAGTPSTPDGGVDDAGPLEDSGPPEDSGPVEDDAGPFDAGALDAATDDAGMDGGVDAGPPGDAGACGMSCTPEPCFSGTVVCDVEGVRCERDTFRDEGACGAGVCDPNGFCELETFSARNPRPSGDGIFAEYLDLSGTRLVVGNPRASVAGSSNVGRVTVWRQAVDTWALEATLTPPVAPLEDDLFGAGVSIDGDRLVTHFRGGYAVYAREATDWVLDHYEPADGDVLGNDLALDGDYFIASSADGARIFEHDGTDWVEKPITGECSLVRAVDLSGNLAALGCNGSDTVQIYGRTGVSETWTFRAELDASWIDFGFSVDLDENAGSPRLLVGALGFLSASRTDGRAFYYEMGASPSVWRPRGVLIHRDHDIDDSNRFGYDVAILDDGRLAVSAAEGFWGVGAGAPWPGVVYVFDRDAFGDWVEVLRFTSARRVDGERFGERISASGDLLAATANDGDEPPGAFYVFDLDP